MVKSVNAVDNYLLTYKVTVAEWVCNLQNIGNILGGYLFWLGKPVFANEVIDNSVYVLCRTIAGRLGSDLCHPWRLFQVLHKVIQFKAYIVCILGVGSYGLAKLVK